MNKEYEQLSIEFTSKAQKLFVFTYDKFRETTKKLDRQTDENVFQLQLAKFSATLKVQLEQIAYEILQSNKTLKDIKQANQVLKDKISVYLVEFRQKAKLV